MNACENPFATDRTQSLLTFRPEWAGTTMQELTARWETLNRRAEILGRHGAGKSTLLASWKQWLQSNNNLFIHIFLNREQRQLSEEQWHQLQNCHGKTILIDGEEQLSWQARRKLHKLSASASGILITRHKSGRLPTLCTLDPDIEILHRCIREIAPLHFQDLAPLLSKWWRQDRGNIREILLRCYDELR